MYELQLLFAAIVILAVVTGLIALAQKLGGMYEEWD